jgi:hypothetical protein
MASISQCEGHRRLIYKHELLERWPGGLLTPTGAEGKRVFAETLRDISEHHVPRGTIGAGVYQ